MGLYRTKPEEVEAIQYTGGIKPFGNNPPEWFWAGMSAGQLAIENGEMFLVAGSQREKLEATDWLILTQSNVLRVSDDNTFKNYFMPTRRMPPRKKSGASEAAAADVVGAAV